jgi:hypothetical protein
LKCIVRWFNTDSENSCPLCRKVAGLHEKLDIPVNSEQNYSRIFLISSQVDTDTQQWGGEDGSSPRTRDIPVATAEAPEATVDSPEAIADPPDADTLELESNLDEADIEWAELFGVDNYNTIDTPEDTEADVAWEMLSPEQKAHLILAIEQAQ